MAHDRYFDSAGVPIRYVEHGSGEPVVLVHSYTGSFEQDFVGSGLVDALAAHYRVIGFDLRGHGRSGKPHDPARYGREMALDIVRLLDHLGLRRAHIVGYSLGAHIVVQLLTLHPERFLTAVLGGACGRRDWCADDDRRVETEAAEIECGVMRPQLARLGSAAPTASDAEIRELSAKYLAGNDPRALAAIRRSNRDQMVASTQLTALLVPTLGIVGIDDPYVASFRALQHVMPQLRVELIEGAAHDEAASRPEFVRAVSDFLRANTGSP